MAGPPRQPVPLADLLKTDGPGGESALGRLAAAAAARLDLLDLLRGGLAAELQPALVGCNLRADGTLVLTAASPAWAARLRFEGPVLLARCRERHPEATVVRVRTATG